MFARLFDFPRRARKVEKSSEHVSWVLGGFGFRSGFGFWFRV